MTNYAFVVAWSFFLVFFLVVEFLIKYRKPGDFINMVPYYSVPKFSFMRHFNTNKAFNFDGKIFFLEFQSLI